MVGQRNAAGGMPASSRDHRAACEAALIPGLCVERILACYATAPGNEIVSGKFANPESSSALAANAFGLFLGAAGSLPPLPGCAEFGWPAEQVGLEVSLRFPWSGGRHPCLDAVVETASSVIGIESKRYEPFRSKQKPRLSDAYWRAVWGDAMSGYEAMRDMMRGGSPAFERLDAAQLVKHAFGLRTSVHAGGGRQGKRPVLFYLFAEPATWPDGRPVDPGHIAQHRAEIQRFEAAVDGDEVGFVAASYADLLSTWLASPDEAVHRHALALIGRFAP